MNNNLLDKDSAQRINTSDSYGEPCNKYRMTYAEAYKQLEFKHKSLQHQYAILQNQYQLYTSQTYNKIANLEKDMDQIVGQKDRSFKTVILQNKNLKQQNLLLKNQILTLKSQVQRLNDKIHISETQLKNATFQYQIAESKQRQIVISYEGQFQLKINQIQSMKQMLNNQRIDLMKKDKIIASKQNQIADLIQDLKKLSSQLENQKSIEHMIRDTNYVLKKQVEQLKYLFNEMESGLKNCEKCRNLQSKNMQLGAIIKGYKQREYQRQSSFSIMKQRQNRKIIDRSFEQTMTKRPTSRGYLTDISVANIQPFPQFGASRTLKQSVVKRCKNILDYK